MDSSETKWWRMTAGRNGSLAVDWLEQDIVTLGWSSSIGDFRDQSASEIEEKSSEAGAGRQVPKFLGKTTRGDGMSEGDVVIVYAPNPLGVVLGVGEVGEAKWEQYPDLPLNDHRYQRSIRRWFDWGTPVNKKDLPSNCPQVYTRKSLVRFREDKKELEEGIKRVDEIPTEEIESILSLVSSEDDLHLWVMRNLQRLPGDLSVVEHEAPIPVGDIDILAKDGDEWVVIEVKIEEGDDESVGQLLGYVGDLKNETDESVRGMLIAEDFTARVRRACSDNDVEIFKVKLNPDFQRVETN